MAPSHQRHRIGSESATHFARVPDESRWRDSQRYLDVASVAASAGSSRLNRHQKESAGCSRENYWPIELCVVEGLPHISSQWHHWVGQWM